MNYLPSLSDTQNNADHISPQQAYSNASPSSPADKYAYTAFQSPQDSNEKVAAFASGLNADSTFDMSDIKPASGNSIRYGQVDTFRAQPR